MPSADNDGVRIHYEVAGRGPPLVLQHGFTQSIEDWIECGYVEALAPFYRVVLIDARGHGASDKPYDPAAYALQNRVADVTAVLDVLGLSRASFWSYSMGGFIGWGMARHAAYRLDALVIGGSQPYARDPETIRVWLRAAIADSGDALVTKIAALAGHVTPSYAARLRAADLQAWLAAAPSSDTMEDMLSSLTMPCLLYSGDADPVFAQAHAAAAAIPGARFSALANLRHLPAFTLSSHVLPVVMPFLATATSEQG